MKIRVCMLQWVYFFCFYSPHWSSLCCSWLELWRWYSLPYYSIWKSLLYFSGHPLHDVALDCCWLFACNWRHIVLHHSVRIPYGKLCAGLLLFQSQHLLWYEIFCAQIIHLGAKLFIFSHDCLLSERGVLQLQANAHDWFSKYCSGWCRDAAQPRLITAYLLTWSHSSFNA